MAGKKKKKGPLSSRQQKLQREEERLEKLTGGALGNNPVYGTSEPGEACNKSISCILAKGHSGECFLFD